MASSEFLDAPPDSADLTDYDREHMKLYMRVLDAATDGADWREGGCPHFRHRCFCRARASAPRP